MNKIVGFKVVEDIGTGGTELIRIWKPTYSWEDLSLGESRFVVCDNAAECVESLVRRSSFPEDDLFRSVYRRGDEVVQYMMPSVSRAPTATGDTDRVAAAVGRFGGVLIDDDGMRDTRDCSAWHYSALVASRQIFGRETFWVIRLDPIRSKARRTRREKSEKKRLQKVEETKVANAKARERQIRVDEVNQRWCVFRDTKVHPAYDRLVRILPDVIRKNGHWARGYYTDADELLHLIAVIRVVAPGCRKGYRLDPGRHPLMIEVYRFLLENPMMAGPYAQPSHEVMMRKLRNEMARSAPGLKPRRPKNPPAPVEQPAA